MSGQSPSLFRPFSPRARARCGERWCGLRGCGHEGVDASPNQRGRDKYFYKNPFNSRIKTVFLFILLLFFGRRIACVRSSSSFLLRRSNLALSWKRLAVRGLQKNCFLPRKKLLVLMKNLYLCSLGSLAGIRMNP